MENELKEIEEKEIITEEDIYESDPEKIENNENKKYDESGIYYVYKHVRLDNNTCLYIGKGKGDRKDNPKRNKIHDYICDKYDYKVVIFKDKLTEEEAFKLEKDLINCYVFKLGYGICIKGYINKENKKNKKYLTNCTWGGEGVSGHRSEETKQRMSESRKGIRLSEETKQKMSESHKGKNNPLYGKHLSEETKQKMSESKKGKNHPLYGKHHSKETKLKLSKKVICITTGETFDSIKEASDHYNVAKTTISLCCREMRKSAGKLNGTPLKWKYLKDYNNDFKGILINPIAE